MSWRRDVVSRRKCVCMWFRTGSSAFFRTTPLAACPAPSNTVEAGNGRALTGKSLWRNNSVSIGLAAW